MNELDKMKQTSRRNDLATIIGKELDLMAESGRFETLYRQIWKGDRLMLAIKLLDKMKEKGYHITDTKGNQVL